MNKKKAILITLIIVILLIVIGIIVFFCLNNNTRIFNRKMEEIQEVLASSDDFSYSKEIYHVFISISDSKEKAYVRNGSGKTLEEAIQSAKEKVQKIISEENIEPVWIKIDVVDDERNVNEDELSMLLESSTYYVSSGISFDDDYNIALLEAELNNNNIVNYDEEYLNLEKVNDYISSPNKDISESIDSYDDVIIFDCISYIYDENGIHRINSSESNYGRREESNLDKERLSEIIVNASNYLEKSVKEDGSFVYEYYCNEGIETNSYNILRHEGTIWSMIQAYELNQDENLKDKIDLPIKYLVDNAIVYKDDNTAFVKEINDNELKLGANGIAVLMFTTYMDVFDLAEYEDVVLKIGNAILEMQNDDGSFYHVYSYPDFTEEEEFRTVYYDGEATYALIKLYEFTNDEKWLNAAEKAMDYFVENDYEQYEDQWIEYSVNEIVDYLPKQEYFELGLNNVKDNYGTLLNNRNQSATKLELLVTGMSIYNKAIENNIDVSFINSKGITNAIDIRIDYQLNCYFYPEYAMYLDNLETVLYAFFVRGDDYRIRIDDVQHNINAFYMLYQIYDVFKEYE